MFLKTVQGLLLVLFTIYLDKVMSRPPEPVILDRINKIESKLKDLEKEVARTAREARETMEGRLLGLHQQLENRIRDVVRHLDYNCRKNAVHFLAGAIDEVEKNGKECSFAKSLSKKMRALQEEAKDVVVALRVEAQDLKLKHIPCLNRNMAAPYCSKVSNSLDRLSQPARLFNLKVSKYFAGDYDMFLAECFDKKAFDMKLRAGIEESEKCKGV